jgi:hypothetical protein
MTALCNSQEIDWTTANQAYLMVALQVVRARLEGNGEEAIRAAETARDEAAQQLPAPAALDRLASAFALSPFEQELVLLCAGVELQANFAQLVARMIGGHGRPTFGLAFSALPEAHWSALAPGGPLRYWRLLGPVGSPSEPLTSSPLRLEERILHFLSGTDGLEERLYGLVRPVLSEDAPLPPSHRELSTQIAQLWENETSARWPVVCLCGRDGGKRELAATVCAAFGMRLYALRARDIPATAEEREALARLWDREAVLTESALLIEADDTLDAEPQRLLGDFLTSIQSAVFVAVTDPLPSGPVPLVRFDVPRPQAAEQENLWRAALGPGAAALNGHLDSLTAQFRLESAAIRDIARLAHAFPEAETSAEPMAANLWEACRAQTRPRLDDLAQRIESTVGWDDLILPATEMEALHRVAAHVRRRTQVYETWGFAQKGRRGLGISALFAGVSGTGKTMAAEVLANELRLDLYRIDLASVVSKYIGETEKNLRRIFDAAEYGGAILLFDEADALFGKRSEVKDSHDRYANIEVSYLLQRMESYRGLAILTTNMKSALDQAFLRRIRFVVQFPFPEAAERARIWKNIFPDAVPRDGLDWERLAQLNMAGGSIRNVALGAAFLAADAGESVGMAHIRLAAQDEYAKLEQAMTMGETVGWSSKAK